MLSKLLSKLKDKVVSTAIRIKRYFVGLPPDGRAMWLTGTVAVGVFYFGLIQQSVYVLNASAVGVTALMFSYWFNHRKAYRQQKVKR